MASLTAIGQSMAYSFVIAPTAETIKTYMDTILLLTTLLFGFAAAFFLSFETEVLTDADARWAAWCTNSTIRELDRFERWCEGLSLSAGESEIAAWANRPSQVLARRAIFTYSALAAALLTGIATYIPMVFAQLELHSEAARKRWWHLFQWPMHIAMFLFIAGGTCFGWTVPAVLRVIFPSDVEVMLAGGSGNWLLVIDCQYASIWIGIIVAIVNSCLGIWWGAFLREQDTTTRVLHAEVSGNAPPRAEGDGEL